MKSLLTCKRIMARTGRCTSARKVCPLRSERSHARRFAAPRRCAGLVRRKRQQQQQHKMIRDDKDTNIKRKQSGKSKKKKNNTHRTVWRHNTTHTTLTHTMTVHSQMTLHTGKFTNDVTGRQCRGKGKNKTHFPPENISFLSEWKINKVIEKYFRQI